jgi:P-type E1-E2 ATPase
MMLTVPLQVKGIWYFDDGFGQSQTTQFQNIATFFVLLNSIIPLSLVVSMELAVLFQALFMMWDDDMRDPVKGGMTVMTSGLNSELGLIEYVLCDKTGTLTQNKMEFKHCSAVSPELVNP